MQEKRAKISFWITVVSFIGSLFYLAIMIHNEDRRSPECKECVEKLLYYQHRSDSLERVLENQNP